MTLVYKQKIIDALRELSDADHQARVWFGAQGPEMSSFVEAICTLFDDSGLSDALDKGQLVFSNEIDDRLRGLGSTIDKVNCDIEFSAPIEFLNSTQMQAVRQLSSSILERIEETSE